MTYMPLDLSKAINQMQTELEYIRDTHIHNISKAKATELADEVFSLTSKLYKLITAQESAEVQND